MAAAVAAAVEAEAEAEAEAAGSEILDGNRERRRMDRTYRDLAPPVCPSPCQVYAEDTPGIELNESPLDNPDYIAPAVQQR